MIFDLEMEKAMLASVLDNNEILKKCTLTGDMFYFDKHKMIFKKIEEQYKKNNIVDKTMLGDFNDIYEILESFRVQSNYTTYQDKIIDCYKKREMLMIKDELEQMLFDEGNTCIDVKTKSLQRLNNIKIEDKGSKYDWGQALLRNAEILESRYNGGKAYYKWGIKILDKLTGGVMPTYSILSARPSVGKTALSLQLGKNVAKQGGSVAFFSMETATNQIINRLICNEGNINKGQLEHDEHIQKIDWGRYTKTLSELSELKMRVYDDVADIETLLLRAEEQRAEMGLDLLILDYIQLCKTKQVTYSDNSKVAHISRELKLYQQRTGVHVLALSQFNREGANTGTPDISKLRDSGSLEQDARLIFTLGEKNKSEEEIKEENESGKRKITLNIAKNSEGESKVFIDIMFYGATQKFYE